MEIKTFLLSLPFAATCFHGFYNVKTERLKTADTLEIEVDSLGDNYPHVFLKNQSINKR